MPSRVAISTWSRKPEFTVRDTQKHADAGAFLGTGVSTEGDFYFMEGKANWAPSRIPPVGQRWVMVLRRV